jgi:undecaprenyl-diphosphatase
LLSVPAVVLSGIYELRVFVDGKAGGIGPAQLLAATLLAFAVGYVSIAYLLRFLATHSTGVFVVYRVALGIVVLVLTAAEQIA